MVEVLLKHGPDLDARNVEGNFALINAVIQRSKPMAALLLAGGARTDFAVGGNTALILAAKENLRDMAALLLDHGAAVDAMDDEGKTAFFFACSAGYVYQ